MHSNCTQSNYESDNKTNIDYTFLRHNILKFIDATNICSEYITSIICQIKCISYIPPIAPFLLNRILLI